MHTDRQTDSAYGQADGWTCRHMNIGDGQMDRQIGRQRDRRTDRHIDRETDR